MWLLITQLCSIFCPSPGPIVDSVTARCYITLARPSMQSVANVSNAMWRGAVLLWFDSDCVRYVCGCMGVSVPVRHECSHFNDANDEAFYGGQEQGASTSTTFYDIAQSQEKTLVVARRGAASQRSILRRLIPYSSLLCPTLYTTVSTLLWGVNMTVSVCAKNQRS